MADTQICPGAKPSDAPIRSDALPGEHDARTARSYWHVPSKPEKKHGQKNVVEKCYYEAWLGGFMKWLFAILVLGLSAALISWKPMTPLLEASAASLACVRSMFILTFPRLGRETQLTRRIALKACLHFFLWVPFVRPRGPSNAKPPSWWLSVLAVSSIMWLAASSTMLAMRFHEDSDMLLRRRGMWRTSAGTLNSVQGMENTILGCACCGFGAL